METRTICCKLIAIFQPFEVLQDTSCHYADACNYVLQRALEAKTSGSVQLHQLCYYKIRELFGLSANLAVRAIRRVSASMTRCKGKRKLPRKFKALSIDYDARTFSFFEKEEMVSLTTSKGRCRFALLLGEHQRKALQGKNPTSAIVIRKGKMWYIHMVVEVASTPCQGDGVMGVDLGIQNIVVTSIGLLIEGKTRQEFKQKRAKIRASLQSKAKGSVKKVLKKLSGYESRKIRHENHVLSKLLVDEAKRHNCGTIRMEQLKEIRSKTKTWNKHRNRMIAGWSFYQLQTFVKYKSAAVGITVELVNPAYTSQTCHHCLKLGFRVGERFTCLTCGEQHADLNASHVIALGGAVCKPARISSLS